MKASTVVLADYIVLLFFYSIQCFLGKIKKQKEHSLCAYLCFSSSYASQTQPFQKIHENMS